jgi:hypothetical protein
MITYRPIYVYKNDCLWLFVSFMTDEVLNNNAW